MAVSSVNVCPQVDVEKPEEVKLIDLEDGHGGEHTVFIMPPEEPQEPDGSECPAPYRYGSALTKMCPQLQPMLPVLTRSCVYFLSRCAAMKPSPP